MSGDSVKFCGIGSKEVPFMRSLVSVSESDLVSDKIISFSCGDGTDWEEHLV